MKNRADVDVRLIVPVVESIETSLKKIFNINIERGKMYVLNNLFTSMGIGAIIDFLGDFSGKIFLDMQVGEVLNVIAGDIARRIQNYGNIKVSVPKIVTKFTKHPSVEHKNIIMIPLGFNKYIINVSFFIL